MDVFIEQLVSKRRKTTDILLKFGIGFGAVLLALVAFYFLTVFGLGMISIVIAGVLIYIGFYFITAMDVEYEYIVTNGEIDIDKIAAKRKRKRLLSVKVNTFEKFGEFSTAPPTTGLTVIDASGNEFAQYYADFRHTKYGNARLIFSPDERTLTAIKPFVPRSIR